MLTGHCRALHGRRIPGQGSAHWPPNPACSTTLSSPHSPLPPPPPTPQVLQTLIRAYFSPAHTTGQRFVYSGSHDGAVYVYDLVTGQLVKRLM